MSVTRADFAERYGPWAVITGASSGLGEGFAHALAARGIRPLLVARREHELLRVAADIERQYGVTGACAALDLAAPTFIDALTDATEGLDVGLVIGNAGFNPAGAFGDHDRSTLERVLDVNARANLVLAETFQPRLRARGRGGIVIVASVEAYVGVPYSVGYAASKAFLLSLAEGLWGESKAFGVDVMALVPGPVDTPLYRSRGVPIPAMSPRKAADRALDHLGRGPSYVPGLVDRWFFRLLRALPRRAAVSLMGWAMHRTVERMRRKGRLESR